MNEHQIKTAKTIAKSFGLKCKKFGKGMFIGSQLELIPNEMFIDLWEQLTANGFENNFDDLHSLAKQNILCGFQIFVSV